jgi:hypothetical protein
MNRGTISRSAFEGRGANRRGILGVAVALLSQLALGCASEADTDLADPDPAPALPIARDLIARDRLPDRRPPVTRPPVVQPPVAPSVSDIKSDGTMRFYGGGADIGVQINVTNVGNSPATGPSGWVNVNGFNATASLHQYFGGTATTPNTVNPGQRGYLMIHLPIGALTPCNKYLVHIDTSRTMQAGTPDPFVNDEANVGTQCLQWTSPINSDNFFISDPLIDGKTIGQIVSSQVVGRRDGLLCSQCHYTGSGLPYSPPVARGGSAAIWPTQVIGGRTWAGPGGYARSFLAQPTDVPSLVNSKPFYLQALLQTWIDDGEKATQSLIGDIGTLPDKAVAF